MSINDYRNTIFCLTLNEMVIRKRKLDLIKKIIREHKKAKNMYNFVRSKQYSYRNDFLRIYNNKCAYCGNSISNISTNLFEIDHFINEDSFDAKFFAGRISNLALACRTCNRSKGKYFVKRDYRKKLAPSKNISSIFFRDDGYNIKICSSEQRDKEINDFYKKLKLNYQTRRLDYLLLNMQGVYKLMKGNIKYNAEIKQSLLETIEILRLKRNVIPN